MYQMAHEGNALLAFNTLSTPAARQYKLVLPDGSRVWLNALSSIRYPTAFTGDKREVDVTGEAYFEVVHNASKPFYVKTGAVSIKDIGTAFDINAYSDEPSIKTTLVEGSVELRVGNHNQLLKPGMQGVISNGSEVVSVGSVDVDEVTAWKDGLFDFNNLDMETVMRQIGRWYNMEIVYEGEKPQGHFSGIVNRNMNLAFLLKTLELNGMHFTIEQGTAPGERGKIIVLR